MASKYWIKLYHEILDDAKIGKMSDTLWRRTIEMFLIAGDYDHDGQLPPLEDIAWRLRITDEQLAADVEELERIGILSVNGSVHLVKNFSERQEAINSTERSRLHRDSKRKGNVSIPPNFKDTKWQESLWKSLPELPGIYAIHYGATGKSYIGASKNVQLRMKQHLSTINSGIHSMSDDFSIYGPSTISVEMLEQVDDEKSLPSKEAECAAQYTNDDLYNAETAKRHRDWDATTEGGICNEYETIRPIDTDIDIDTDTDIDKKRKDKEKINTFFLELKAEWLRLLPEKTQPRTLGGKNTGHLKARMNDKYFIENWKDALDRASRSTFLNASGFFTFWWFITNDENWQKCLDGNYDDKGTAQQHKTPRKRIVILEGESEPREARG